MTASPLSYLCKKFRFCAKSGHRSLFQQWVLCCNRDRIRSSTTLAVRQTAPCSFKYFVRNDWKWLRLTLDGPYRFSCLLNIFAFVSKANALCLRQKTTAIRIKMGDKFAAQDVHRRCRKNSWSRWQTNQTDVKVHWSLAPLKVAVTSPPGCAFV